MSTTPPEQPTTPGGISRPSVSVDLARMPIPGNAEFALYLVLEIIFSFMWWFREDVTTNTWMTFTTALTFGYFISRGIAKASRVLEQ